MVVSVEENKAITRRIVEEFINKNNPAVADELFADDFVNHSPRYGVTPDRDGLKQMIALGWQGFPDFHLTIEDMIAENDKVVARMRTTGTNTGEFMGIQPTNKSIDSYQISIVRIEGGKVKERWNIANELETMRQLGLM
jgi:predicted ester cyclase